MKNWVGIIILAAGPSERLGSPKQLLEYKGKVLLQHVADEAKASEAAAIIIVTGFESQKITGSLNREGINMVYNNEWKEGVSSSVRAGLKELVSLNPGADAAIFMVCDQPLVTYELLDNLMTTHYKTGKPIITSAVDDDPCPPALFHQSIFPELLQLTGDHGARKIIEIHAGNLVKVPFAGGKVDIDTEADYRALI